MKKSSQQDVVEIVGKIEAQLVSLEKKIDLLISRPFAQPSQGQRQFSQPGHNDRMQQGQDYRQRNMFKVICADCNKECEIPFKPRPDRPVYCRECFSRRKTNGNLFKAKQENTIVERDFTGNKTYGKKKRLSVSKKRVKK